MGGAASVDASSAANLLALSSLTLDDDINHVKATTIPVAYGEPKQARARGGGGGGGSAERAARPAVRRQRLHMRGGCRPALRPFALDAA